MEYIKRLEYNKKAMEMCYLELKKAIENGDDFQIYLSLGNLLHWIIMTEEWHKEHNRRRNKYENDKKKNNMDKIMKGIRFANNSMKHNMMFVKLHIDPNPVMCGSDEAICGAFYCQSDQVLWNNISNFKPRNNRDQKQYECYNECLRIKSVVKTLEPVIEFLVSETDDYLSRRQLNQRKYVIKNLLK